MTSLSAKEIVSGACDAAALVTRQPINFVAALCKAANLLPFMRAEVRDQHHELFGKNIAGSALVFPSCVGSTYTGLVLLELVSMGHAPAALIVQSADPLLVSGIITAQVWYEKSIPVLECPGEDIFRAVRTGDRIRIEPGNDQIHIEGAASPA